MDANGPPCAPKRGASRITAWIEIDGAEQDVLAEGGRLLRMITEDLEGARVRTLRLEYDPATARGGVVQRGTHALDVVAPGVGSPEEATLWRLVLGAGVAVVDAGSAGIKP